MLNRISDKKLEPVAQGSLHSFAAGSSGTTAVGKPPAVGTVGFGVIPFCHSPLLSVSVFIDKYPVPLLWPVSEIQCDVHMPAMVQEPVIGDCVIHQ